MMQRPIRVRRGRRTDFAAVMRLLAASGVAVPPPDRATLRRFRQLVADLGSDLYLATVDDRVVGLAHVTYARQLASGPVATLATLVVGYDSRGQGVGTKLLQLALSRARKRACVRLRCTVADADISRSRSFLLRIGVRPAGNSFEMSLAAEG